MKYSQRDFSLELKELINATEHSFVDYNELLLNQYTPFFTKKNQRITLELKKYGTDPFKPNFYSFVSVEIHLDNYKKVVVEVPIWKTQSYFLGIPFSKNIPGSKVIGKLVTLDVAKDAIREFIEDNLK